MQRIDFYKEFFTHEREYYAVKLIDFERGKKYSFNFWAGLLGLAWFCYRKMYLQSVLIFFIGLIVFYILNNGLLVLPVSFVALGFLGNYLYLKKSIKTVDGIIAFQDSGKPDSYKTAEIRAKGGTSMTSALICAGLLILIQLLSFSLQ